MERNKNSDFLTEESECKFCSEFNSRNKSKEQDNYIEKEQENERMIFEDKCTYCSTNH